MRGGFMSTKQFISAEEHLAKLGLTSQQALNFIIVNVEQPEKIFDAAFASGVTINMLSEITNISTNIIVNYFSNAELNPEELDQTSILVNSDLGNFESLVGFNNNSGDLSNSSLSEAVRTSLENPNRLDFFFLDVFSFQSADGIYDAEELGVGNLENVPATEESLESLFFGTLINSFSQLDESELNLIRTFPHDGSMDEYQMLLSEVFDESSAPGLWTSEQLAELVVEEANDIISDFFTDDLIFVGTLDRSFLVSIPS